MVRRPRLLCTNSDLSVRKRFVGKQGEARRSARYLLLTKVTSPVVTGDFPAHPTANQFRTMKSQYSRARNARIAAANALQFAPECRPVERIDQHLYRR